MQQATWLCQVSVFETNIRVVGGLLSAHHLAQKQVDGARVLLLAHESFPSLTDRCCPPLGSLGPVHSAQPSALSACSFAEAARARLHACLCARSVRAFVPPIAGYSGSLLRQATDLANRLLPAFNTPTGIPFGTINLRFGVPHDESTEASVAGAGTIG